ncbi:MAG: hypothetical protein A2268_04600 [Candidatus Raymondbacteria bacterium RifOxyA12_full_50_37]|nr:MAG: hypothetical protein A2268_04600 [Candidatus Raymondbacteria bacterium RifOxyA12_full_50_37]OGJ94031.1 MAG: hypothetical protein A2248_11800 [Candidatus Raymondbacteria bacterium RIFOXYA2_FULL_49_16]OGJ96857.1 MAG: hypothetical protein A2453_04405 [Candidatus Raymondbacteria bacterium RIFOXYC2_FULL_50_21]OGJ97477.1 MAG: hypothetical protein A2487_12780 [Candidatus Raymondbacteria bacterium RifOxyC12_full_50_8]OGJ99669.1 MAG: hypothetical protein A2350_17455 [Candidatus Raymondbacteria b
MVRKILYLIGPGCITASLVIGPGSVTVATKVGSLFGFDLVWWLAVLWLFMVTFTLMSARIGLFAGSSFMTLAARKLGRPFTIVLGISVFLICCSFQAGDVIGVSSSLAAITNAPETFFKVAFPLLCLTLYFFSPNIYTYIERLMLAMVVIMLGSFLTNLIMARPSLTLLAAGFVPKMPHAGQMRLFTAMAATNFVVAAALYQSYLVREKGWSSEDYSRVRADTIIGISVLFLLVGVITVTSATVLKPRGINVQTAADMALQLEPLLGAFSKYLFCCGLFAASFSSLAVNALTGATLLSDSLGRGGDMKSGSVKILASCIMLFGLGVSLCMGGAPVKSIILLQRLTLLTVPLLAFALVYLANTREITAHRKAGIAMNCIAGLACCLVVHLFMNLVKSFF